MKATLSFDLPEDDHDFKTATLAVDMSALLFEIRQDVRCWQKGAPHDFKRPDDVLAWLARRIDNDPSAVLR